MRQRKRQRESLYKRSLKNKILFFKTRKAETETIEDRGEICDRPRQNKKRDLNRERKRESI